MTNQSTLRQFSAATGSLRRAESWQAWNLHQDQSDAIPLTPCEAIGDAVTQALERGGWQSGDTLAVQHSHAGTRSHTLWQFRVTRSTRKGFWRAATDGGRPVFVGKMEAKLFAQVSLAAAFEPVLRFDALRDDAVGVDRSLVVVRS